MINSANNQNFPEIRAAVRRLCEGFPGTYWQALDRDRVYPTEFVEALSAAGFYRYLSPSNTAALDWAF